MPPSAHHPDRQEAIAALRGMIEGVEVAMLTTTQADGRLVSRPLGTQDVEFDGLLWFATGADSEKVREIQADPRVNLAYASRGRNTYVSVSGKASIVRDRAKIEHLWSPAMKLFFPGGKDDPNLVLIRVQAESAEYWDGPGTMLGKALHFLIAAMQEDPGVLSEQGTLRIR